MLKSESGDVRGERFLVGAAQGLPLGWSVLTKDKAGEALRDEKLLPDMVDTTAATSGAQEFPEAASRRISFSGVSSEKASRGRSLSFPFSSSFSRFTWSVFKPTWSLRQRE